MEGIKTLKDAKLAGKRVLLRADYNVPMDGRKVAGDYRLTQSLPTLEYILKQKPERLIIISHLGRPDGQRNPEFSLLPVAERLAKLLGKSVHFVADCVGDHVKEAVDDLGDESIILLENLRFYSGEENNDANFAQRLVEDSGAEVFIQDGFGTAHRNHASYVAITKLLPSYSGFLMEKEITTVEKLMSSPERPLTAVVGGAKISDKIEVLKQMIGLADCVAVVGALANNFLVAQDVKVGKSLIDKDNLDLADEIIKLADKESKKRPFKLLIPVDGVVSTKTDGKAPTRVVDLSGSSLADIEAYPKKPKPSSHSVAADEMILDIGPVSAAEIVGAIELSRTTIWAGTCGMAEVPGIAGAESPFAHASRSVAEAMIGKSNQDKSKPFSFVGGGDTTAYVESTGMADEFSWVSTGGSASLELIIGKKLPGIEALKVK
jgi:phosphoglycerate kinase